MVFHAASEFSTASGPLKCHQLCGSSDPRCRRFDEVHPTRSSHGQARLLILMGQPALLGRLNGHNRRSATPDSREVRFGASNPVSGEFA